MKNKLLTISLAFLFLTIGLISAKDTTINHNYNEEFTIQKMEQIRNTFENNYQLNCSEICEYREYNKQVRLEIREQNRFLFWDVESISVYEISSEGELVKAHHNFWSLFLNRNKIKN